MPKRTKDVQKTGRTRSKSSARPVAKPKAKKGGETESAPASERFVRDLLVRGEAVKPDPEGKLPLEATHAITKQNPDGTVVVKRVRFKAF